MILREERPLVIPEKTLRSIHFIDYWRISSLLYLFSSPFCESEPV